MSFLLGSDGKRHEALVIPGGGGRIPPDASETGESAYNQVVTDSKGNPWSLGGYCKIWMDPMAIFAFSVSVVPPHLRRHLELAELGVDALDALLLHQANKIIIESIGKKLGLEPAKVPFETLPMYGNLGSSSIPALICEHYSPGGQGADEARGKVMLCGFGAGLAWASCLLSLEDTKILPVKEYRMAEKPQGREERIAYWHGKFSKA